MKMFSRLLFLVSVAEYCRASVGDDLVSDIGTQNPVTGFKPYYMRDSEARMFSRPTEFYEVRREEHCVFPIQVAMVQDKSDSFRDDYPIMKNVQLPKMIESFSQLHPNSTFGVTMFSDKPILNFGWPDKPGQVPDKCFILNQPLTSDPNLVYHAYDVAYISGGNDIPENQFGALLDASQSKLLGFDNPLASDLLVLSTDSPAHYYFPGMTEEQMKGMTINDGIFDEANSDAECVREFYPSPEQVRASILNNKKYVVFLIAADPSTEVYKGWVNFNRYIGQPDEFVQQLKSDSSNFWDKLSRCLTELRKHECQNQTTTTRPPTSQCQQKDKVDLVLVQDASNSFSTLVQKVAQDLPDAFELISNQTNARFGLTQFVDKPIWKYGQPVHDFCFQVMEPLTNDSSKIIDAYKNIFDGSGVDYPEDQFDALIAASYASDLNWNAAEDSYKFLVLFTNSTSHVKGDASQLDENDGYGRNCMGADYASIDQLANAMQFNKTIPVFATTADTRAFYEGYVVSELNKRGLPAYWLQLESQMRNASNIILKIATEYCD